MKEYKRLTDKDLLETITTNDGENIKFINYAMRLKELEDKIENGTLIELQDKEENLIGQQIYAIDICSYPKGEIMTNFEQEVEDEIIIGFTSNGIVTVNTTHCCNSFHTNGLWFLTKAEAEAKLKELESEI